MIRKLKIVVLLLTAITLVLSCSQDENEAQELDQQIDLSTFSVNHVEISSQIFNILENEEDVDYSILRNRFSEKQNFELNEINDIFKSANIINHHELTNLINELGNNSRLFAANNLKVSESEIEESILLEMDHQSNNIDLISSYGPCENEERASKNRCHRNFAISTALAVGSGLWSFGLGAVYAETVALLVWADCMDAAWHAYRRCIGEEIDLN